jgi:triacylglycerol lipase
MLDILGKYLKGQRCHFYIYPKPEVDRREAVVLIHGLIRRSYNMYPMARFLCDKGFTAYVYDYKTSIKTMAGHGDDLRDYLRKVIAENPDMPINIVTHSMGGILIRYALGENNGNPALDVSRIKRVVMLAPPHGGSKIARRFVKYAPIIGKWFKTLPELSDAPDSIIHSVPLIEGPEIGIVGAKYDQEVAMKDTYLEGMKEHFIIKAEHSFMVYMKSVQEAVLRFLTTGTFTEDI